MCGIIGWKDWDNSLVALQEENSKRGVYSTGFYQFRNQELMKKYDSKFSFKKDSSFNNIIMQYRTPTTEISDVWKLEENYPLEYMGYKMFGNGIINANYYKKIKDEYNNNDLYYILKNIYHFQKGYKYLEEVEGTFALAIVTSNEDVILVRKDYPLYYNENVFSSVEFEGGKLLEQGLLFNWTDMNEMKRLKFNSVYLE